MSILKPSFFKQTDSRWSKAKFKCTDGGYSSVGVAGCGSTAVANVVNALIKNTTPKKVFKYACKQGYQTSTSGLYRSAIPKLLKHFGINPIETIPRTANGKKLLKSYLKRNYWAIAIMGPGTWTRGGHYILAYYVDSNGYVYISDSASSASNRQKNTFTRFWDEQKDVSWLIVNPRSYVKKKSVTSDKSKKVKSYTLYTNNNHANVRKARGVNSKLIGTLGKNKEVKVKELSGGWWKIASGKYKGYYINESNLSKYKTYTKRYKTLYTMNVRSGYTTNSKVLRTVEKGRAVKSTKQKGNWAYIPAFDGWICIKDSKHTYMKEI